MEFDREEVERAVSVIGSTIAKCEKMQDKFPEGTSRHSLLRNRIKALRVAMALLTRDAAADCSPDDLQAALPPVLSIIRKTEKAQSKYEPCSPKHKQFEPLIQAMRIAQACIGERIGTVRR